MLRAVLHFYGDHAIALFAGTAVVALVAERLSDHLDRYHHDRCRRSTAPHDAPDDGTRVSLASGLVFVMAKAAMGKLVMLAVSLFVYSHLRLFTLDLGNPLTWIAVFVLRDAIYYWVHRCEHRVRALWAAHMVHHSPETIGFSTAVRVPWMEAIYKPWIGLWVPLVGFNPTAMIILDVLAATIGQLQHTTACRRRTVLDRVLVTPSAHRVHHGSNREYIDKNFGAVFIVWDRLFGTYEPEAAPVRYGLTGGKAINSVGTVLVGGYRDLVAGVRRCRSATDAFRYLVSAPGDDCIINERFVTASAR